MGDDLLDEKKYTRVTTVLNVYNKYDSVPLAVLNYAADRGTRVHKYAELYANRMLFGEIDSDCVEYVQAFINWFDENVEEVYHTEKRLGCDKFFIQGQIDMIAKIKGLTGSTVVDIKTSSIPAKTWELQTSAYHWLAQSTTQDVNDRVIIHVKKDGTFDQILFPKENQKKDFSLFKKALELYRHFS